MYFAKLLKYRIKVLKACSLIIFVGLFPNRASAQNLEKIGQKDALKISGGISANQVAYYTSDTSSYREPYTWVLTGSLNINLYDWVIPLSYTVSNYSRSFQQPFNQFSMHPTYKWIKAHVGYTQMSFSPYSLNGHNFLGGGVELTPTDKFHFSAMLGRLKRPIEPDTSRNIVASYKRMGFALKAGYKFSQQEFEVSVFRGWDIRNSLANEWIDTSLHPMENVVLTLSGKTILLRKLTLTGEIAGSSLTADSRSPIITQKNIYTFSGLTKWHSSTYVRHAYKAQLSYSLTGANVGVMYEHVDPQYQTLGAYYANNDFENYTINAATSLLNNKLNVSLNTGIQYDDLKNNKTSKTYRYVAAVNLGVNLSQKFSFTTGYSNFTSYTNIRSPFEDINQPSPVYYIDSLRFTQIAESINASANLNFSSSENIQQTFMVTGNYMQTKDNQGENHNLSHIYSAAVTHNLTWKPLDLNFSTQFNAVYNDYPANQSLTIGPTFSTSKMLLSKTLQSNASISQNITYMNGKKQVSNFVFRIGAGYTWQKHHVFSLSLSTMSRKNFLRTPVSPVRDITGTLTYNYSF